MKIQKHLPLVLTTMCIAAFAACLVVFESDYLWKMQELDLFLYTPLFFQQKMVVAGGCLSWLATYFQLPDGRLHVADGSHNVQSFLLDRMPTERSHGHEDTGHRLRQKAHPRHRKREQAAICLSDKQGKGDARAVPSPEE